MFLHADYVRGEHEFVQPCIYRPGVTDVGVGINSIGNREIPEPLSVYFRVQDKGDYRYEMSGVSFDTQDDCPDETRAAGHDKLPSLFKKN